jgi:hypothetical protein
MGSRILRCNAALGCGLATAIRHAPPDAIYVRGEPRIEDIQRGHGISITYYRDDEPDGIYFAGYSFD